MTKTILSFPTSMFNINRRQFLLRSAVAIAATVTYDRVQAQQPTSPGALPKGLPRRKVVVIGAGISGLVAAYELQHFRML